MAEALDIAGRIKPVVDALAELLKHGQAAAVFALAEYALASLNTASARLAQKSR